MAFTRFSLVLASLAFAYSAAGCEDEERPTLDELQDGLAAATALGNELICECYDEQTPDPFASREECISAYTAEDDAEEAQCLDEAYGMYPDESLASLTCTLAAFEGLNECYRESIVCGDYSATSGPCRLATLDELNQCPELPMALIEALAECRGIVINP